MQLRLNGVYENSDGKLVRIAAHDPHDKNLPWLGDDGSWYRDDGTFGPAGWTHLGLIKELDAVQVGGSTMTTGFYRAFGDVVCVRDEDEHLDEVEFLIWFNGENDDNTTVKIELPRGAFQLRDSVQVTFTKEPETPPKETPITEEAVVMFGGRQVGKTEWYQTYKYADAAENVQQFWGDAELAEYEEMRRKLTHGFPLTIAQQRRLFEAVFGEELPTRKRCKVCEGTGKVDNPDPLAGTSERDSTCSMAPQNRVTRSTLECPECNGEGTR